MAVKKRSSNARRSRAKGRSTPYDGGAPTHFVGRVFDARPDRLDFRDFPYRPPLRSLPTHFPPEEAIDRWLPAYVKSGLVLDQGAEGACTGFGLACVVNYMLFVRHLELRGRARFQSVSPRMLYELAKRYDEWPGETYEGSSCRGALKGWHKHGVCGENFWPYPFDVQGNALFVPPKNGWERDASSRTVGVYYRVDRRSVVDLQAAICEIGAVYVSGRVHDGWDALLRNKPTAPKRHKDIPDIEEPQDPGKLGGHAFALVGFDEKGFVVQNSWGTVWGAGGFGRLAYDDWVKHGTDAWGCALGVPVSLSEDRLRATRWPVPAGRSLNSLSRETRARNNPADDPWPIDHEFLTDAYEPLATADAYARTLVTGNDGVINVRDLTRGGHTAAADYARHIVVENPLAWFTKRPKGHAKLVIYAHGGLNGESESINRVRVLAPYFEANGVYPLFLTWRTGPGETLVSSIQDWIAKIPGATEERAGGPREWLSDQRDRAIEIVGRLFGRGVWAEMRENAARGMRPGHGLDLTAQNLLLLATELKKKGYALELHLVGHSAGSILLGHLLERFRWAKLAPRIETCTLYAAACSVRFAVERYVAAADDSLLRLDRLWLYVLSDANEKGDSLPSPRTPAYGKSLLYLVSRALDDVRKMPLLGMERAVVPGYHDPARQEARDQWDEDELPFVADWQKRWRPKAGGEQLLRIIDKPTVRTTRAGCRVQSTHGSFDNNIEALTETLERVAGKQLLAPMEWLDY